MRTVEDDSGRRYLLVKRSGSSSRVRDPETGEERHLPNDRLSAVEGASPLETAAEAIPGPARRLVGAVPGERALGLLVDLAERGPLPVRSMLSDYELCESDLHGVLAALCAAGLIEEVRAGGERGYDLTDAGEAGLAAVQSAGTSEGA